MVQHKESLEQKVERLEFYIDILRSYIANPEVFILWDWSIANRFNRPQVYALIDLVKRYNQEFIENSSNNDVRNINNFIYDVDCILINKVEDFQVDQEFVFSLLRRTSKMGIGKEITAFFLINDSENSNLI